MRDCKCEFHPFKHVVCHTCKGYRRVTGRSVIRKAKGANIVPKFVNHDNEHVLDLPLTAYQTLKLSDALYVQARNGSEECLEILAAIASVVPEHMTAGARRLALGQNPEHA